MMEFYLDTADVAAVERLAGVLPIKGVTTNLMENTIRLAGGVFKTIVSLKRSND